MPSCSDKWPAKRWGESCDAGIDLTGFTDGSILYVDSEALVEDPANLLWDDASLTLIARNLTVLGTFTTNEVENLAISDQFIYLNVGYDTAVQQDVGIVANYLPTATGDTVTAGAFVAGIAATSNPTVITDGSDTFAQGDIIQISGTTNDGENDGFFEVEDHTGTTLTIRGVGTQAPLESFSRQQFVANASDNATITNITVAVLHSDSGVWETASGSNNGVIGFAYTPLDRAATLLFGARNVSPTTTVRFLTVGNQRTGAVTTVQEMANGRPGTLRRLTVFHNIAGVGTVDVTYTVIVDGAPTPISVTVSADSTSVVADLVNEKQISANAKVSIQVTKAAAITTSPLDIVATLEFI